GVLTPDELARQILDSKAFAARHPQMASGDNGTFVTGLYRLAFNRAPDSGRLAFWTTKLAQGTSRSTMAARLVTSPDFRRQLGQRSQDMVDAAYYAFLDRTPERRGFGSRVSAMLAGEKPAGLVNAFLNSQESKLADSYRPTAPLGTETQVTPAAPHL